MISGDRSQQINSVPWVLHIRSGKLTLHRYDDFWGKPVPRLLERIKIKMRQQDIEFFEYGGEFGSQYLYLKSRYLAPDCDGYERQAAFDRSLEGLGAFDFSGFGPPAQEFDSTLAALGLTIDGFAINQGDSRPRGSTG